MKRFLCSFLFVLLCSCMVMAQDTGSITGAVRDSSGAVVSDASVTISNSTTGVSRQSVSNGEGEYLVAGLPAGTYILTIVAKGFEKYEVRNIILRVAQKQRLDIALKIASVGTNIDVVEANAAQVETQDNSVAATITGKELTQLQLNGRNFTQLITLSPGVSNQTGLDEGGVGLTGNVQYSVNGGRQEYNNWELDGGDMMDNGSNTSLNVYPSIEAIGEVKVLTSNYGAQYGRNASGTVEAVTKSGTNTVRVEAYEFLRNDAFNAKNYFVTDQPIAEYKKNDFGYNIGGPIYKNKAFFFWSEEWRKDVVPGTVFNQIVPSNAERAGDFSDVCQGVTLAAPGDCPINRATGLFFPGNQVPVDPNAVGLLNLIPTATSGSSFIASPAQDSNWREELFKLDYNVTDKLTASFRFIHDSITSVNATAMSGWSSIDTATLSFPNIETQENVPGVAMVARLTYAASPTLLNEFVASYTTDHVLLTPVGAWQRPANSTMTGIFNNGFGNKISGINVVDGNGGYAGGFAEDPSFLPFLNSNPTYTYRDNITKIFGNHNLQFGGYFVAAQKNEPNPGSNNGLLVFNTASGVSTGNAFADLLTGQIGTYTQTNQNIRYYNRYKIFEPYLQDDWHVSKRLTLNLGLRISLFGTYRELNKNAWNFEPSAYNPATAPLVDASGVVTGSPGALIPGSGNPYDGLVQCGATGVPAGCQTGHLFNPAPRLGFAWDPWGNGKTAIRGGYGIFFEHTNGNEGNSESLEGSAPAVLTVSQNNISGYTNIGGAGGTTLFPLSVIAVANKAIWPYAQQWHLDVQRDLIKDTVMTISYVGTKGTHLTKELDANQIQPLAASQNPYIAANAPLDCTNAAVGGNLLTGLALAHYDIACGFINGTTDSQGNFTDPNSLRPYPGIGTITTLSPSASSIYHALQFSARRTSGPLTLDVAYTWSHSIDDSSDRADNGFVNGYAPNRASSNFDQRHIISVSYVYDLPFFRSPGLAHTFLGGWQYSGISEISSGTPFSVLNNSPTDNAGVASGIGSGSYADLIGNPNATPAGGRFPAGETGINGPILYNPAAYAVPVGLTFGDSGRNSLRYPWRTNFDMALYKNFSIKERAKFEFRTEAFNVFNHTEWQSGAGQISQTVGTSNFLQTLGAHNPRILQFGLKAFF